MNWLFSTNAKEIGTLKTMDWDTMDSRSAQKNGKHNRLMPQQRFDRKQKSCESIVLTFFTLTRLTDVFQQ